MGLLIDVSVTVDSDSQLKRLNEIEYENVYFNVYDERYKKGKKEAWSLKNQYAAQLNPFIEIKINGKFYHMIYSEASNDPFGELETMLKKIDKLKNSLSS